MRIRLVSKILNIAVGSTHVGYELKLIVIDYLKSKGYNITDCGCFSQDYIDYSEYANAVVKEILSERSTVGILICTSGTGAAAVSNCHDGIRAVICGSEDKAEIARKHDDANVLSLGAKSIGDDTELVKSIIDKFLST